MGHPANLTFEHSLSSTAAPSTPARPQRRPRDLSFIVPQARDDGGSKARSTEISARTSELLQLLELLNSFICYRLLAIGGATYGPAAEKLRSICQVVSKKSCLPSVATLPVTLPASAL